MTRENGLVTVTNFIVGYILAAFALGVVLGTNGLLVVLVAATLIWLLRVPHRPNVVYAVGGLLVGVVLTLLVPQLGLDTVGVDSLIQGLALLFFCYKA